MAKDFLLTPLTYLPGVGPRRAKALAEELDLYTYLDLLHYFPTKYVDRSRIYQIRELRGEMPHVELKGYIRDFKEVGEGRKKRLVAYFTDGTGTIELVWFRSMPYIRQRYIPGQWYLVFGKPVFFNGAYSISHPEIDEESKAAQVSGGLMPVYPLTEKLTRAGLNSRQMRQLLYVLKEACVPHITETLTPEIIERARLMSYAEAIEQIHFPVTKEGLEAARRRLKFDELFFIQLRLLGMKRDRKAASPGLLLPRVGDAIRGLYGSLPFDLTGAQKRVIREIQADVISGRQMNRLIQGDVGSGKTLVALFSMLLSVDNGYQACMMAPTEILARQHYASLCEYLAPLGIEVGLLIGSTKKKERTRLLADLSTGALKIIVGTHALLEPVVQFAHLGLAVIDEQHRFGVAQRAALRAARADGRLVHELVMTATPIPRTIAMTVFGDLDETRMEGLPAGRAPVATHLVDASNGPWIERLWRRAREEVDSGGRVYVVCPRIDEDDAVADADDPDGRAPLASVASVAAGLRAQPALRGIGVGELTGRTPGARKAAVMADFASGATPVLVATTVVEVGVDVPEATLMVIIDAQQFGLSTLHQLRGRVGRSSRESLCVAVHRHGPTEAGERRLRAFASTTDGFELAEADLRLRKEGDVLGAGQSGTATHLEHLSVRRDGAIIRDARAAAERLIDQDPSLAAHPQVLAALREQAPRDLTWIHRS